MLKRKANWQGELDAFFLKMQTEKFQYGSFDCCSFACGAVEAQTDTDIFAEFRGRYATRKQALEVVRTATGKASIKSVVEYVARKNDMPEVSANFLQRGDFALVRRGQYDHSLGIVSLTGRDVVVALADGTGHISMNLIVLGWKV